MKKLFFALFLVFVSSSVSVMAQSATDQLQWHTDLMEANRLAVAAHKPIFAFFTGSDWCGWCHKLQNEVFSKASFAKWAKEKVILLELDFPRQKQLPPALAQQNNSLQQAFGVQGFPTVWYFTMVPDSTNQKMLISALGSQGYPAGAEPGKEDKKFLDAANEILTKFK